MISLYRICVTVMSMLIIICPANLYAKTYAYLIQSDMLTKLDVETDEVVSVTNSPSIMDIYYTVDTPLMAVDFERNVLVGSNGLYMKVFNLDTLQLSKQFAIPFTPTQFDLYALIYPEFGQKYIVWYEDGETETINKFLYSKDTHEYLGILNSTNLQRPTAEWMVEQKPGQYMVIGIGGDNLRTYSTETFEMLNSVDLTGVYASDARGHAVKDVLNGIALLSDNKQKEGRDYRSMRYYKYSINSGTVISNPVQVEKGAIIEAKLIANSNFFVFESMMFPDPKRYMYPSSLKLYKYDFETGKQVGELSFDSDLGGKILGISPSGTRLYYSLYSRGTKEIKLNIIDTDAFKVIKIIPLPQVHIMKFYEESDVVPKQ